MAVPAETEGLPNPEERDPGAVESGVSQEEPDRVGEVWGTWDYTGFPSLSGDNFIVYTPLQSEE